MNLHALASLIVMETKWPGEDWVPNRRATSSNHEQAFIAAQVSSEATTEVTSIVVGSIW
jgi:hypothetical protein